MRRRGLLALGAVSAVALVLGGGTLALLQPGLYESKLSGAGREVFSAVARGLLDGSLPAEQVAQMRAITDLLDRIDLVVAGLPPHAQSELSQLLSLLASSGGRRALAGVALPWSQASVADIQRGLQDMRASSISLRQQAYQALHDIVGSAYFADPQTWPMLGYPGPQKV